MDHLIDNFDIYIDSSFNDFYQEWKSGQYKKFSECPSYYELKTLLDSVNPLRKYIGWERLSIKDMLDYRE
ncbi:hypothetical protein [Clostridium scatologenes]|uniref:Uncharacterized protein n=1 Tax=Clostridium scatologenes TaxID=1548 RepID=A0A0E3K3G6_CLOSL|nr:hypothetical protein [Clostridium scatologenes]AKA71230.1 hypothetical protein CSCA_4105 [Clostridium scatologenes]